jgi:renalase
MRAAIVGAGICGLAAGQKLAQAGVKTTIFEKSRGVGGRAATKRLGPYTFDSGATVITPGASALAEFLKGLGPEWGLRHPEGEIWTHANGVVSPGDPNRTKAVRWVMAGGMNQLGKALAQGLDVRLESKVDLLTKEGGKWLVQGEAFDFVILTCPLPQSKSLMETSGFDWKGPVGDWRQCLSLLLGFEKPLYVPWFALVDPGKTEKVVWLSAESVKSPGTRAPDGHSALVVHLNPSESARLYEEAPEAILAESLPFVTRLLGEEFGFPVESFVHRWRYSQADNPPGESAAYHGLHGLLVAGDGVTGSRLEGAYDAGIRAAERSLNGMA